MRTTVEVAIPQHVSASPESISPDTALPSDTALLVLRCHRSGCVWYGLKPIFMDASRTLARQFLRCLFLKSSRLSFSAEYLLLAKRFSERIRDHQATSDSQLKFSAHDEKKKKSVEDEKPISIQTRRIRCPFAIAKAQQSYNHVNIVLWIQLPSVAQIDMTFTSAVIRMEHAFLQLQALTSWMATLGGGYFFCRRLKFSLQMSRYQRKLALILGNTAMAQQCVVNEVYNLLYSGKFPEAMKRLNDLWLTTTEDDTTVRRQCRAARLLCKRLKKVTPKLREFNHVGKGGGRAGDQHGSVTETVDDYQRIRIIRDEDY